MSTPLLDALSRAMVHGIVEGPPAGDPLRLYVQIVMIHGRQLTREFWHHKTNIAYEWSHVTTSNRLTAVGIGRWFEPWCSRDALAFCAVSLDEAMKGADWPRYPHTIKHVCLGELAAWISDNATPGGGRERWHWNPNKRLFN
jgi:hypothetical protein